MSRFTPSNQNHQKSNFISSFGNTEGIVFQPQVGKHTATVIFIHGLGDSASGLEDIVDMWSASFPHVKFILPTARSMPISVYFGQSANAWYDITSLDENRNLDENDAKGIDDSKAFIESLIYTEVAKHNILLSRIMLMGFSQGGAMSLYTGLQLKQLNEVAAAVNDAAEVESIVEKATKGFKYANRLGGLLVLSGYLPNGKNFNLENRDNNISIPILHLHGKDDPLVKMPFAEKTKVFVQNAGVEEYVLQKYDRVGHSLNMEMINHSRDFLTRILPEDKENADLRVKVKHPKELSIKELKEMIKTANLQSKAVGFSEKSEFISLVVDYYNSQGILFGDSE